MSEALQQRAQPRDLGQGLVPLALGPLLARQRPRQLAAQVGEVVRAGLAAHHWPRLVPCCWRAVPLHRSACGRAPGLCRRARPGQDAGGTAARRREWGMPMRIGRFAWPALLLLAAACAGPAPPPASPRPPPGPAVVAPAPPPAPPAPASAAEAEALRAALAREVPARTDCGPDPRAWIAAAADALAGAGVRIDRPQLLVAVDRNPQVQQLCIILAAPEVAGGPVAGWLVIGGGKVSTGQAGRKGYYITPTGVFAHTEAILDYRALGTVNENGIRGLGAAGMRVWDFGWQTAVKGWRDDGETGEIRLLLHATDPDLLESRLGRPASQGCVRIAAAMNRFLDRHGVLDWRYERLAAEDPAIRAVLAPDRTPTPLAGDLLVVFDSAGRPAATPLASTPTDRAAPACS
ncbi:MAG: hypothetical protein U1E53_20780 [Dongiaceae bacterium]